MLEGIKLFNAGAYYACHETLERLWLAEPRPIRELYRGVLQVGVGLYHLDRSNVYGADRCFGGGLARLRPFSPTCMGIGVAGLIADIEALAATVRIQGLATARARIPTVQIAAPDAPRA